MMSGVKKSSYEYYQGKTASDIDYREFIEQLALESINLTSSRIRLFKGVSGLGLSDISVSESARWEGDDDWEGFENGERIDNGFQVYYKFVATIFNEKSEKVARVDVEYELDYLSLVPLDDEAFEIFSETTVPLNTWPFLREYLSSTTARMGWEPYFLPARSFPST